MTRETMRLRTLAPKNAGLASALPLLLFVLFLCGGALTVATSPWAAAPATAAEEGDPAGTGGPKAVGGLRIGVFDSRAIVVAFAPSSYNTFYKEHKDEFEKAKAAGDEKKVAELKKMAEKQQNRLHHQGFGREPVDDLLACVKERLPEVCKAAGVDAIVHGVVHADPSVETVDVTERLVRLYDPDERVLKIVEEIRKRPPMAAEDLREMPSDH